MIDSCTHFSGTIQELNEHLKRQGMEAQIDFILSQRDHERNGDLFDEYGEEYIPNLSELIIKCTLTYVRSSEDNNQSINKNKNKQVSKTDFDAFEAGRVLL